MNDFARSVASAYHEGPLPKETKRFDAGNVAVFVFPAGNFRKNEYAIRVGRWRAGGKQFYSSEFVPLSDLDDLLAVLEMAKDQMMPARIARSRAAN